MFYAFRRDSRECICEDPPEEERQQQDADVAPVHISVCHDDHSVVAQLVQFELDALDAQTQSANQRLQLRILSFVCERTTEAVRAQANNWHAVCYQRVLVARASTVIP